MAKLEALLSDLSRALEAKNEDTAASVRRTIAEAYPETPEGAEARYKLGLAALYRAQDLDLAAQHFREATKAKQKVWSACARTSLGLVLLRQGKHQQAVFELRRAAAPRPADLMVAQAASMLVMALAEMGNTKESARARTQQLEILDTLAKSDEPQTAAIAQFYRGMEHKFDGERGPAKALLSAALAAELLPTDERAVAERALAKL